MTIAELQQRLVKLGYKLTVDGIVGNKTISAIKNLQLANNLNPTGVVDAKTLELLIGDKTIRVNLPNDKITLNNINLLHPRVRIEAGLIYEECVRVLSSGRSSVRFTSTLRTNSEQDILYSLGRTVINPVGRTNKKPMGNIVSNAKGGQSIHQYGLAIDFALLLDKDNNGTFESVIWDINADFDNDLKKDWMEVVSVFKKYNWEWGGDWTSFKDYPHVQKTFGLKVSDLINLVKNDKVDSKRYVLT